MMFSQTGSAGDALPLSAIEFAADHVSQGGVKFPIHAQRILLFKSV